jgi:hypothetical protein
MVLSLNGGFWYRFAAWRHAILDAAFGTFGPFTLMFIGLVGAAISGSLWLILTLRDRRRARLERSAPLTRYTSASAS